MDGKKVFWIVAVIVALAAVSAAVAYFVTRYLRAQKCEEILEDYCDYDYDDYEDYDCDCDCEPVAE
ncbi:MAG: hypothetical protein IJP35_06025 [Clostridia bacterium]|nr:hypothetical protein [Clostridia bacterium]